MKLALIRAALGAALLTGFSPMLAHAALFKTFVSANGNDANACDLTTPCATLARAVTQTVTGGMVSCLDSKDYSLTVTITVSLTIDCAGTTAGGGPFIINGSGITVVIKNILIFDQGVPGISFTHGAGLIVENVHINNAGGGIYFQPSDPGSRLSVYNSLIRNNTGAGIVVQPSAGNALVDLKEVRIEGNAGGVYLGAPSSTQVNLEMRDTQVSGNSSYGFVTQPAGGYLLAVIDSSTISNNGTVGVYSVGALSYVFVTRSTITGNYVGWTFASGGNLISFKNNSVVLNSGSSGTPSATISEQ